MASQVFACARLPRILKNFFEALDVRLRLVPMREKGFFQLL